MRFLYLIKCIIYGSIASYGYSINSKFTLAWSFLAIICLSFFVINEIKELLKK